MPTLLTRASAVPLGAPADTVRRFTESSVGSSGPTVAALLTRVATGLAALGDVEVHDVVVSPAVHVRDETTVTVYYEPVP